MERPGEEGEESPPGLEAMWGMETGADCDCPGPPPEFLLPPPPRPPFLQSADPSFCSEDTLPMETCDALPANMEGDLGYYYRMSTADCFPGIMLSNIVITVPKVECNTMQVNMS
ncbi:hypothetical protein HHI36_000672 [Cryptolaemus montrouzieri]|uniref:Uncharacterized protein n=1 Tax=Cryptolaemus montrouzieri TaxID=559131 RepID=A0ABD2P6Q3_9CUCU